MFRDPGGASVSSVHPHHQGQNSETAWGQAGRGRRDGGWGEAAEAGGEREGAPGLADRLGWLGTRAEGVRAVWLWVVTDFVHWTFPCR